MSHPVKRPGEREVGVISRRPGKIKHGEIRPSESFYLQNRDQKFAVFQSCVCREVF